MNEKLWDGRDRLLRFEKAEDFMSRKMWLRDVDAKVNPPIRILGGYHFPTERHLACGLSGCRHMHGHGFLVLLKDGHETHIGRFCGRTHVGAIWEELEHEFKATEKAQAQMDVIADVLAKKDETLKTAKALLELVRPAEDDVAAIRSQLSRDSAVERAFTTVSKLGGQLTYHRFPTERERDLNPGIRTIEESIGRMDGLAAASSLGIGGILENRVIAHLEGLDTKAMLKFKGKELDRYTRFISDMSNTLRRAQHFLNDAAKFIRPQNWQMFEQFCQKTKAQYGDKGEEALKIIAAKVTGPAPPWVK